MDYDVTQFPTSSSKSSPDFDGSNSNMEIRLVCVEDGLENMGFRKFAGYVKLYHPFWSK